LRALAERNPDCNRPRLEAVALACPAKRGVGLPSWRVFSESISESQSGPGSNSLRETDWNTDADSDPDPDRTIGSNRTPERLSLSGSHDQRPRVWPELRVSYDAGFQPSFIYVCSSWGFAPGCYVAGLRPLDLLPSPRTQSAESALSFQPGPELRAATQGS
jgi:hypothetical protein